MSTSHVGDSSSAGTSTGSDLPGTTGGLNNGSSSSAITAPNATTRFGQFGSAVLPSSPFWLNSSSSSSAFTAPDLSYAYGSAPSGNNAQMSMEDSMEEDDTVMEDSMAEDTVHQPTTTSAPSGNSNQEEDTIPDEFLCPISLELMRDPVIVATGQTYDRSFIQRWIDGGNVTCPKTHQKLQHSTLTPNYALRSLIAQWCTKHNIEQPTGFTNGVTGDIGAIRAVRQPTTPSVRYVVGCPWTPSSPFSMNAAPETSSSSLFRAPFHAPALHGLIG